MIERLQKLPKGLKLLIVCLTCIGIASLIGWIISSLLGN